MADRPGPPEPAAARRRRDLDAVFGEVLPDATADERSLDAPAGPGPDPREEELLRDVPPHHG